MIEPIVFFRFYSDARKKDFLKLHLDNKGELTTIHVRFTRPHTDTRDTTYCAPHSDLKILETLLPEDVRVETVTEAEVSETMGVMIYRPGMTMPEPPESMKEASLLVMNPYFQDARLIRKAEQEVRSFRKRLVEREIAVHLKVGASVNSNAYRAFGKDLFNVFERLFFPLSVRELKGNNLIIAFEGADPKSPAFFPELLAFPKPQKNPA